MDMISHAIIGAIIAELVLWEKPLQERIRGRWIGALISATPDIAAIPAHFVFSWSAGDWPWVYDASHWVGVENSLWLLGYWFTHSLILPFIAYFWFRHKGWPVWMLAVWASHSAIDILSHTGAWSIWPFFPFPGQIEGVADPWSWSPVWWAISISICLATWYSVSVMTMHWREDSLTLESE